MKLAIGDKIFVQKVKVAEGYFSRLLGLMFKKKLDEDSAMVIPFCNWIHTFFMRFDIDVIYVDSGYNVIDSIKSLKPWRMTLPRLKAKHVIELPKNSLLKIDIKKGVRIKCLD